MALSFVFGSLYWTNVLWSTIIKLGRSIGPVLFIYTNYILVHSTDPYFYILSIFLGWSIIQTSFLVSSSNPIFTLISLILGLLYKPIFFLFLGFSTIPISSYWTTLVYQSIQILGLLYRPSFLILVFFFLGCSTIRIIFLIYFFFWSPIADQFFIFLFVFLGLYTIPIFIF